MALVAIQMTDSKTTEYNLKRYLMLKSDKTGDHIGLCILNFFRVYMYVLVCESVLNVGR